ncbi:translational activator of cytochrome c oxidase 1 [Lasioglossum baleicum]|uniref:translational activator of cytochrome c oxidase 1 n=1 Tax=Lasioglossum baleicum TaxID=434251 RepID=UPI003FCDAAE2
MSYRLGFLAYDKCRNILLQESRRYAGHSKWQNIKHVKAEQDAARSNIFRALTVKMKSVIQETGIADPSKNLKLSQLVEQAKKANMPAATLKQFFEKMKNSKQNAKHEILLLRCPGGAILVVHMLTDKLIKTKLEIFSRLKKHNTRTEDETALRLFDCACYITAMKKDCNADQAMEDAIKMNAHDVEEIKDGDETLFQFKCDFGSTKISTSQLTNLGYSIIDIEELCIPESPIELSEEDLNNYKNLKEKLIALEDIEKIDDNVLEP